MAKTAHQKTLEKMGVHLKGADEAEGKGCVVKCKGSSWSRNHGSYRRAGYDETKGDSAKSSLYVPYTFTGLSFYRQARYPFRQNSHHIMPMTSLVSSLSNEELEFLMKAGYNLNSGKNIIILPCEEEIADEIELPDHPYGHPVYNEDVAKVIAKLQLKIEKLNHEDADADGAEMKKKLDRWQDKEFKVLVKYGKTATGKNRVNGAPMA